MAIIENGTIAVNSSDVASVLKSEAWAPPPTDVYYGLRVTLKGTGSASAQQWVFSDQGQRDEFYKRLVDAMEK